MAEQRTFRAVGVTIVMLVVVVLLAVLTSVVGLALPDSASFSTSQTATIWLLVAVIGLFGWAVARSRVTADDQRIIIVNGFTKRQFRWSEVSHISFADGAPWPTLVTKDDQRVALFAIQGSEGSSARESARWLQGHVA